MKPSESVKRFGTDDPPAPSRTLRAGVLEARLEAGNLRYIKVGGIEALRAIAFLVRDKNWGTYNAQIDGLHVEETPQSFRVTYSARCADDTQSLAYEATIEGRADGSLTFEAVGTPQTDILTNRTGFIVLHPLANIVDRPLTIERTNGDLHESRFPARVDPACPFTDIRALTHVIAPGVSVTCRMEGDAFEMEDHRNWLDASFKTYVRELARPWPYLIAKDDVFTQKVTITVSGTPRRAISAAGREVTVRIGEPNGHTVPRMGLAVPAEHAATALERAAHIKAARPGFLVCHFDPRAGHDHTTIATYRALGEEVDAPLFLEAVLPSVDAAGQPTADRAVLARDVMAIAQAAASVDWERVAFSPASDLKCTLPGSVFPPAPSWRDLADEVRAAFPGVPVGGGMFSYFTELNRKRPPAGVFDFVCHTGSPIVHAGDDESVTETLEALPSVFASVRGFMGETPYYVFPTAISMRMNPYGAAPAENPNNVRQAMNRVDPRDRGLLGAAWYAGYLAHAAQFGIDGVTLAAVAGPAGVLSTPGDGPRPWFDDVDAAVMPSWHAFAFGAALSGHAARDVVSDAPRDVQAVAADGSDGIAVVLANLTDREQTITLAGLTGPSQLTMLDSDSFQTACLSPHDLTPVPMASARLVLGAYAVALIQGSAE